MVLGRPGGAEDVKFHSIHQQDADVATFLGRGLGIKTVADSAQPVILVGDATKDPRRGRISSESFYASGQINRLLAEGNVFEIRAPSELTAPSFFVGVLQGFLVNLNSALDKGALSALGVRATGGFSSEFAVIIEDIVCSNFPGGNAWIYVARFDNTDNVSMIFADNNELTLSPQNQLDGSFGTAQAICKMGSRTAAGTPLHPENAPSMPFLLGPGGFVSEPRGYLLRQVNNSTDAGNVRPFERQTPFLLAPGMVLTIGSMAKNPTNVPPGMGNGGLNVSIAWREERVA